MEWLYQYAVAVTFNTLITRGIAIAIKLKTDKVIYADRASYAACALVAAVIQPFLWEAGSRFMKFAIMDKNLQEKKKDEISRRED